MPFNSLSSRRVSKEKYHSTPFSWIRSISKLSKEIFCSQPQHMAAKKSWKETTSPGYDDDSHELFQQKQYFMDSVFNKVLKSDIGKTTVRKYAPNLDAQSVWKEFETHMSTSSKSLNERHRLHAYVSTTVYDWSWKGNY